MSAVLGGVRSEDTPGLGRVLDDKWGIPALREPLVVQSMVEGDRERIPSPSVLLHFSLGHVLE